MQYLSILNLFRALKNATITDVQEDIKDNKIIISINYFDDLGKNVNSGYLSINKNSNLEYDFVRHRFATASDNEINQAISDQINKKSPQFVKQNLCPECGFFHPGGTCMDS